LGFSAQTTTGFSSINVAELGAGQKTSLCFSMLVGGGIGSTAGGFKILRLLFFFLLVKTLIIGRSQSRHAVIRNTIFNYQVTKEQFYQASAIIILYGLVTFFSGLCFIFYGYPAVDSFFEVTSAVGTVGLSAGITGPDLPLFLKAVLSFDMLLGRLEIFPWLIVLFPATWFSQKLEER
jgi:trk system potassium uptake protein TrkH